MWRLGRKGSRVTPKISFHLVWMKMSLSEKGKGNQFEEEDEVALEILWGIPLITLISVLLSMPTVHTYYIIWLQVQDAQLKLALIREIAHWLRDKIIMWFRALALEFDPMGLNPSSAIAVT